MRVVKQAISDPRNYRRLVRIGMVCAAVTSIVSLAAKIIEFVTKL